MATLKSGSTMDGTAIKTTSSSWAASELSWAPNTSFSPTTNYKFVRYGRGNYFELTDTVSEDVHWGEYGYNNAFQAATTHGPSPTPIVQYRDIDEWPFAAGPGFTATDVGDVSHNAYTSGWTGASCEPQGIMAAFLNPATGSETPYINKFPWAFPVGTLTDSGNLNIDGSTSGGHASRTDAYFSSGNTYPITPVHNGQVDKYPASSPASATDVGDLQALINNHSQHSNQTKGWCTGGFGNPPAPSYPVTIESFPFESPFVSSTDVGNLSEGKQWACGVTSVTDGYSCTGRTSGPPSTPTRQIDKFPFSSPFTTATDAGDISNPIGMLGAKGNSSSTDGFISGGGYTIIDKFPFSSPFTTATDFGDLSRVRTIAGQLSY